MQLKLLLLGLGIAATIAISSILTVNVFADRIGNLEKQDHESNSIESLSDIHNQKTQVEMNEVIIREPLNLLAWEEDPNLPPRGIPLQPDRPISFAMLSVTFENKTTQVVEILIKLIAIQTNKERRVINSLPATNLVLMPLEISPQQYQMSNRESYSNTIELIGILIYELDGKIYTLESDPVSVQ